MRFLTAEEAAEWCGRRGLSSTPDGFLDYPSEATCFYTIATDDKTARVIALADQMVPTWEAGRFQGALLWIKERGVWSEHSEGSAALILGQMRAARGERASLDARPGHLFEPSEMMELHAFLLIPLLFGWDTFLVPEGLGYFYFCSHDGALALVGRDTAAARDACKRLTDWGVWEDTRWYPRFVGRERG